MAPTQQKALVEETALRRSELQNQIAELSKKRSDYLRNKVEEAGGAGDSLDEKMYSAVREQAGKTVCATMPTRRLTEPTAAGQLDESIMSAGSNHGKRTHKPLFFGDYYNCCHVETSNARAPRINSPHYGKRVSRRELR